MSSGSTAHIDAAPTAGGLHKKTSPKPKSSIFDAPEPIRQLFSKFPLVTYPTNELPHRARRVKDCHALYIFTTPAGARMDSPSFNPGCLKWQTYLKFLDIPFVTVPSSNHASPTGALPFLFPSNSSDSLTPSKLESWAEQQARQSLPQVTTKQQPYATLLAQSIRLAYLHALYLDEKTFAEVAAPYYTHPCSKNVFVRSSLAPSLRAAALDQVLIANVSTGPGTRIDLDRLYKDADDAFEALSMLLGEEEWFTQVSNGELAGGPNDKNQQIQRPPGMLDASVFSYTHVILTLFATTSVESPAGKLRESIMRRNNLVEHQARIARLYYNAPR